MEARTIMYIGSKDNHRLTKTDERERERERERGRGRERERLKIYFIYTPYFTELRLFKKMNIIKMQNLVVTSTRKKGHFNNLLKH